MTTSNPGHPAAGHPPALQLYTVREQLAAGRAGVLNRIAGFGYAAVEPFGILDDPAGLAADLAAAGLAVCSVHATPAGEQAGLVAAAARVLGTDTVIVPYLPPEQVRRPRRRAVGGGGTERDGGPARGRGPAPRLPQP